MGRSTHGLPIPFNFDLQARWAQKMSHLMLHDQTIHLQWAMGQGMDLPMSQFFSKGVGVSANLNENSIRQVLCHQIGVDPDYLDHRIQTVFLDGMTVDNVDTALLFPGSTLALSAAMPGLAGATLRKGGFYAALRAQISYDPSHKSTPSVEALFRLKLFNLVLKELSPLFLSYGIWIEGADMSALLHLIPDSIGGKCTAIELNGDNVSWERLNSLDLFGKKIQLKVSYQ